MGNNKNSNKTSIKKKYKYDTIIKLMDATQSIIDEKGVNSVTIREIANRSGLNSATIYKHFKNLDHLIFFVLIKYTEEYNEALTDYVKSSKSSIDFFLKGWECFLIYSFKNPDIYYKLYFTSLDNAETNYMEEYYKIFPYDNKNLDAFLSSFLFKENISHRNTITLDPCIKDGYFDVEKATELNEIQMYIYEALIARVSKNKITSEEAIYKGVKYIYHITKKYSKIDFTYVSSKYGNIE